MKLIRRAVFALCCWLACGTCASAAEALRLDGTRGWLADNNANLLLNFGPKPDGSIPDDVATNFRLLGKRIRDEGYPAMNRTTYLDKCKQGSAVDKTEKEKTAR